ncbi:uncharacterized protein BXZ73DRAFT_103755 [Epithele typhae]|uniref:uncharacterized protein n=1 Tax=Epithele typhae TaxID=378194 RepID=UPI00200760CA|nr:uncharacterized protein BXZ73DRAFT_103755 [Epithele typhae]KAH9923709.1 hypothetical protein BXZ73DRAFT_103755 [Epithele typhae]
MKSTFASLVLACALLFGQSFAVPVSPPSPNAALTAVHGPPSDFVSFVPGSAPGSIDPSQTFTFARPSGVPSGFPSDAPALPSGMPNAAPSGMPSGAPSGMPSGTRMMMPAAASGQSMPSGSFSLPPSGSAPSGPSGGAFDGPSLTPRAVVTATAPKESG